MGRLSQIFDRYAALHLALEKPGLALTDETGHTMIGQLDRIRLAGNRLIIEGWTRADRISAVLNETRLEVVPDIPRPDVASALAVEDFKNSGFLMELPYEEGPITLCAVFNELRYVYQLDNFDAQDCARARRRLYGPFLRAGLHATPPALQWFLLRDNLARAAVKNRLGLQVQTASGRMAGELFGNWAFGDPSTEQTGPGGASILSDCPADTEITIVLPVYNAYDLLPEVLDRVLRNTDLPWRLVMIEDCSSDDRVRPFLHQWIAALAPEVAERVHLIENPENRGFIRSVNSAFDVARDYGNHVVLLNSDAFVPVGWASRLMRPLFAHDNVATVTPMSNDAEIFTAPVICQREVLTPGLADQIDVLARSLNPDTALVEAPTGVGFCMAMHLDYLKAETHFDTGFGRGYGEEVDWCQRVRQRGGRHLGTGHLFVEHRGGSSFGSEEKMKLVLANNAFISKRYPEYDREVQDFIQHDPLATPRLALAIAWAAAQARDAIPVYLGHAMGGGAEDYLRHRIEEDVEGPAGAAVVLRVGHDLRWHVELHCTSGMTRGGTDDLSVVEALLASIKARHIVYSCGVGDRDPLGLPAILLSLKRAGQDRLEVLFHDFFPISPSYTLLGADGRYHGVPAVDTQDKAHRLRQADGRRSSLAEWQEAWGGLISAAEEITVFSQDSRDHVCEAYPQAQEVIRVRPHKLLSEVDAVTPPAVRNDRPVIGVLGNIGYQKGARVLSELSETLAQSDRGELVVVGNVDPTYPLAKSAHIHGHYQVRDIPDLIARYNINLWLIPSIWPETFSYVTQEAIATGLPVWSFDLGAQGQTVRQTAQERGQGGVIPLQDGQADLEELLDSVLSPHT